MERNVQVERMNVYEFLEKDGSCHKFCVVVSADDRKWDTMHSVIFLKEYEDQKWFRDQIIVSLPTGDYAIECKLVTYANRARLGNKVGKIGEKTRKKIQKMIGEELGLFQRNAKPEQLIQQGALLNEVDPEQKCKELEIKLKAAEEKANEYKQLYNGLLGAFKQVNTAQPIQ